MERTVQCPEEEAEGEVISTTQSNNTPEALRRYREGWERAFGRKCEWCGGSGVVKDTTNFHVWPWLSWENCPRCNGTGRDPEGTSDRA